MSTSHAILLTAQGSGAIAVVRLVGEHVGLFLGKHFSPQTTAGRVIHGELRNAEGDILDDPVVSRLSPTAADLNLHGSPWIVRQVLDMAGQEGFDVVSSQLKSLDPLAVDRRPWVGSLSSNLKCEIPSTDDHHQITEEVLTHLPLARTELAVRALLAQPHAWAKWAIPGPGGRRRQAKAMLADRALWWLLHPPRVAIVGKANVGKSTLANQLFAQERSIVADQPGTTRDWVGELANVNDLVVMLVDTPGQRQTDDPIELEAIRQSGSMIKSADMVIEVLDASVDQIFDPAGMSTTPSPAVLLVANKQDRRVWTAQSAGALPLTATTGQGVDELRRAIVRYFGCDRLDPHRPRWWTARQRSLLEEQVLALNAVDS